MPLPSPAGMPRAGNPGRVLKNDVARFSGAAPSNWLGDEGAGRWPVTEEATTSDGMPRPKTLEFEARFVVE
jgi:hypothetical protein